MTAQESASITFDDQESDGQSVVITSARTPVNARLLIVTGRSTVFRQLELDAGAQFTDRSIELTNPIQQSQRVRAEIRTADGNDELLARDRALIAVGESLENAQSTLRLPNGTADLIDANPEAGFYHPYVLYRPRQSPNTERPLYVQTLNVPPSSAVSDPEELRSQVTEHGSRYLIFADQLGLPGLVPGFPRTPNDGPSHIQGLSLPSFKSEKYRTYTIEYISTDAFPADALERVDRQLLQMIDDARERLADEEYEIADGIHMNGFSASAQFASRFAFLHPDRVSAITIGGNGAYPLPRSSLDGTQLPYPLGLADYEELTGSSFNKDRWTEIDQYIYLGGEDTNEFPITIRYEERASDVYGDNRVEERLPVTKSVYQDAGASAEFSIFEGAGHVVTSPMADDVTEFHRSLLDAAGSSPDSGEQEAGTVPGSGSSTEAGTDRPTTVDGTPSDTAGVSQPGFGIGTSLASIAAAGYFIHDRLRSEQSSE